MQTIKVAHFRLTFSRQMFVAAYPRETQEMVFDAHNRAFAFFGGVPQRMVYDTLKGVVETIFTGKERLLTAVSWCGRTLMPSNRPPALRPREGRRVRSKTRSATSGSGCLPRQPGLPASRR